MPTKIFFLHTGNETFTRLDRDLLRMSYEVDELFAPKKFPARIRKYFRGIENADLTYCWFAGWNSFWAILISKILKKPSILIVGGYDVANLHEANYGHQRGGLGKLTSKWAMQLSNKILPFSEFSKSEAEKNAKIPSKKMRVVYIGVPDHIQNISEIKKERVALTVGGVDWSNLKRKGLEPFVRTAELMPDVKFILIGKWSDASIDYLRSIATPNVIFTGKVSDQELLEYYKIAEVYVQPSLHEGFGLSVAEAMLAGCIPVVTRIGSLPEVVGNCGVYCVSNQPKDICNSIQNAFETYSTQRQHIRDRILQEFSLESRAEQLNEIIQSLMSNKE